MEQNVKGTKSQKDKRSKGMKSNDKSLKGPKVERTEGTGQMSIRSKKQRFNITSNE